MHPIEKLWKKEKRLVIGLMSGTSADGIDAALCEISGSGEETVLKELEFITMPFEPQVREHILAMAEGKPVNAAEVCKLKTLLGIVYGEACLELCRKAGLKPGQIDLVGCHGQTVWHIPYAEDYLGCCFPSTLQIGEEAEIAQLLGCPVVGDFRVRDVAAGGQGAPLVPYTEYLLYRSDDECVALQNVGGIGNVTIMPSHCMLSELTAFDTGPGNMVIDALVARYTGEGCSLNGEPWTGVPLEYDDGGRIAASGKVSDDLLAYLMNDPYLTRKPPKTTGREVYGKDYVNALLAKAESLGISMVDVIATATRFTAETIALGIREYADEMPARLVVNGGGSHNVTLMNHLKELLPDTLVVSGEEMGHNPDAKEAVAFALLANEFVFGQPSNAPAATGAAKPVVLGKLTL